MDPKKINEVSILNRFIEYLNETNLNLKDYLPLLPQKLRSIAEKHFCGKLLGQ
jgi:hypothetical protein